MALWNFALSASEIVLIGAGGGAPATSAFFSGFWVQETKNATAKNGANRIEFFKRDFIYELVGQRYILFIIVSFTSFFHSNFSAHICNLLHFLTKN